MIHRGRRRRRNVDFLAHRAESRHAGEARCSVTRRPPTQALRFDAGDEPELVLPVPDDEDEDTFEAVELGLDCFEVDAL